MTFEIEIDDDALARWPGDRTPPPNDTDDWLVRDLIVALEAELAEPVDGEEIDVTPGTPL